MTIHYVDDVVTLHHGDCLDVLRTLEDCSVDSVVTDPPYGIAFMGKQWDQPGEFGSSRSSGTPGVHRRGPERSDDQIGDTGAMDAGRYDLSPSAMKNFQRWCEAWATECLRVLKPGGHIVSFGGSRTWHRLAAAIEDSGFELRDSIAWLYGSGFPKSLDVSKAIDKAAGAQRDVVGPNPRAAQQTAKHSTTTLSAFAGVSDVLTAPATDAARQWQGWGTALKPSFEPIVVGRKPIVGTVAVNVLTHGTGALNVNACRVGSEPRTNTAGSSSSLQRVSRVEQGYREALTNSVGVESDVIGRWPSNVALDQSQAERLDRQSGIRVAGGNVRGDEKSATGDNGIYGHYDRAAWSGYGDTGGASRFFPTFHYEAKAPASERPSVDGVQHPTVKPLDLMRWLVRLVTPPNGVVLEPFAGSGTTAEACVHEHMRCIAIEREADYLPLIVARLSKPIEVGFDFGGTQ
ncbi:MULTISPECIES: site-specific DNA-methyltransferase [unclassified Rhodococcus (in: high G+C Gram-positive bacteria)]|uniref:DNA-methyltransferase n=1 Tax=unclassified Rhodococcus (in: high G+C Gram-positive bacteria) TaxID=192944 RepID=UPI000B9A3534|nr:MULTISPECIES: site-specific DNA-methyltransferase [unclassified Rhodococcus (in: high G+C Gram-positive bacteria)]OZE35806.1 site-specific DNA-methyltransferase [Rhodococcus sp. 05-2254-4]OZE48236.1 site-specific DNA-methyltransferase [Rhodococcus sp. 05-2254-3]OZE49448.1 site-specific DNA-methyltransferase [Rhodococcus sp. 05-2254-2]